MASNVQPVKAPIRGNRFNAYGLIRDRSLHQLYQDAHLKSYEDGNKAPRQVETQSLLENLFLQVLFPHQKVLWTRTNVPRAYNRFKPYDFLLEYDEPTGDDIAHDLPPRILCFAECKNGSDPELPSELCDLGQMEEMAREHCGRYLEGHHQYDKVFALTAFGTRVQFWRYKREEGELRPCWDDYDRRAGSAIYEDYKDVGVTEDASIIVRVLVRMCQQAQEPHAKLLHAKDRQVRENLQLLLFDVDSQPFVNAADKQIGRRLNCT